LNAHVPTEDKSDVSKDRLCEETELVFYQFPKYSVTILIGHFSLKLGKCGSEILYELAIVIMLLKFAT
jgi:hypothetical protein